MCRHMYIDSLASSRMSHRQGHVAQVSRRLDFRRSMQIVDLVALHPIRSSSIPSSCAQHIVQEFLASWCTYRRQSPVVSWVK